MAYEQTAGPSVSPYISAAMVVPYMNQYPPPSQPPSARPSLARHASAQGVVYAMNPSQPYAQPMQGYASHPQVVSGPGPSRVRPPGVQSQHPAQPNGRTTSLSPHVSSHAASPSRTRNGNPSDGHSTGVDGNGNGQRNGAASGSRSGSTDKSDVPPSTFPYHGQQINVGFPHLANGHGSSPHVQIHGTNGQGPGTVPRYAAVNGLTDLRDGEFEQGGYIEVPSIGVGAYFGRGEDWLDSDGYNFHPLYQPSAGVEALNHFTASLDGMVGGNLEDWSNLIETHFDDESRVQLTLVSNRSPSLRLFDISAMALARVLTTWTSSLHSSALSLRNHVENSLWSPPQSPNTDLPYNSLPRHGIQVESEGEWKFVYTNPEDSTRKREVVWRIVSKSDWVGVLQEGVLKMESWDVVVEEWMMEGARQRPEGDRVDQTDIDDNGPVGHAGDNEVVGEWGIPRRVLRELEVTQQVEDVFEVLGSTSSQADARATLESLIKPEQ